MPHTNPLVLTLGLDPVAFAALDRLRREHFPPERNVLPAHLTLFHTLPGEHEAAVRDALAAATADVRQAPHFRIRGAARPVFAGHLRAGHGVDARARPVYFRRVERSSADTI